MEAPVLPRAIASFGAATTDGYLYVFGGHVGRAHQHSRDNLVGSFWRLNLHDGQSWEQLPDGPPLQGTTLVAGPNGELLRIGGLDALNAQGDDEELHSRASVQRFAPHRRTWTDFPPLPEPRSSHDAIVVNNTVYVVGGWHLAGDEEPAWHRTAWACDLTSEEPTWSKLPTPPFVRRACAVARFGDRVAVIGGMDEDGTSKEVWLFDPRTGSWQQGPELPGGGFGAAGLGIGDALYATVMDGRIFRLDAGAEDWAGVTNLAVGRFFHRLSTTPDNAQLIALGGASRNGHLRNIEFVAISPMAQHKMHKWVLPFPGQATRRPAIVLENDTIFLFGGNKGTSRERFSPEQLVDTAFALDLTGLHTRQLDNMPHRRQSMTAVAWGRRAAQNLVFGGMGPESASSPLITTSATSFSFDPRRGSIQPTAPLPAPRTQFQAVSFEDKVWVFGGTDFQPDDQGGGESSYPLDVLVYDPAADAPSFATTGATLQAPRRSFGAAVLGTKAYLIGGLAEGFQAAEHSETFDFHTQTWSPMPAPPKQWVSPQVATIGDRIYVSCGGTMSGQRFTEDRAVYAFDAEHGWQTVVEELPFRTRHVQMRALRDRLLFLDLRTPGSATIYLMRPHNAPTVVQAAFEH